MSCRGYKVSHMTMTHQSLICHWHAYSETSWQIWEHILENHFQTLSQTGGNILVNWEGSLNEQNIKWLMSHELPGVHMSYNALSAIWQWHTHSICYCVWFILWTPVNSQSFCEHQYYRSGNTQSVKNSTILVALCPGTDVQKRLS